MAALVSAKTEYGGSQVGYGGSAGLAGYAGSNGGGYGGNGGGYTGGNGGGYTGSAGFGGMEATGQEQDMEEMVVGFGGNAVGYGGTGGGYRGSVGGYGGSDSGYGGTGRAYGGDGSRYNGGARGYDREWRLWTPGFFTDDSFESGEDYDIFDLYD
ncbi:uncharacterized protein LOC135208838 [Macrobrachium nipponense]|uniref:uncharacterized protein LOC135208838 n=1 Tax=Macrobrachium nipponense TaxID=159736 RepID=UPI0030C8D190